MKQTILLFFTILLPMMANADVVEIVFDDIFYKLDDGTRTAEVIGSDIEFTEATAIVIPKTITYNDITYSVTTIGECAFYGLKVITSVIIPNSVITVGRSAFYGCSSLKDINIPNSVTNIGQNAFYGTAWYDNLPDGLIYIGKVAYRYIGAMQENTSIILDEGTSGIADNAFSECSKLTSITIPNSVTYIGSSAFSGCSGLLSISIPNSVTSIEGETFFGCCGLTSVTIPNSVITIGASAFESCTELANISIPNSVVTIGEAAFAGCASLSSIIIPESVTSIGVWAFSSCINLSSIVVDDNNPVYDSQDNCNAIIETQSNKLIVGCKNSIIPNSIVNIGETAFSGCNGLVSIIIPSSVASIGRYAFFGCNSLEYITIPYSVISIGGYAFDGTTWYDNQPDGLIYAGKVAYKYKGTMPSNTNIVLESGTLGIAGLAFAYCRGLKYITIPSSVTNIGIYAFEECNLTNVKVLVTDYETFSNNKVVGFIKSSINKPIILIDEDNNEITEFTIPNGVSSVDNEVFANCEGLEKVYIPSTVTSIGDRAFSGCNGLTSITFPSSITSIGSNAFAECGNLTNVKVLVTDFESFSNNKVIGLIRSSINKPIMLTDDDGNEITEFTIPYGVTTIGLSAFRNCTRVSNIIFPSSLTSIGRVAFEGCTSLKSIVIPSSVVEIGNSAFANCSNLKRVFCYPDNVPSSNSDIFTSSPTIYVPESSLSAYRSTSPWSWYNLVTKEENATEVDGIYYYLGVISPVAEVTSNPNGYTNDIVIPENIIYNDKEYSVTSIGNSAFSGCSGLASIKIPNSVMSIGNDAFNGCEALQSIDIPNKVTMIGERCFSGCSNLNLLSIPNSVTSIGQSAFEGCSGLTTVDTGNGVTSVPKQTFYDCSNLTTLTIGENVNSVGLYAFAGCPKLKKVTCLATTVPETNLDAFKNSYIERVTLRVPESAIQAYDSKTPWSGFKEIIAIKEGEEVEDDREKNVITFGETDMMTFCSDIDLDFTAVDDLKAYTATGYDNGTLTVTRVLNAPAGTGLLLKGTAGETYEVPYATSAGYYINLLKGLTTDTWVSPTEGEYTNFLLGKKDNVLTFYRLSEAGTVSGGKAYLQLPTSVVGNAAESRVMRIVEDETTSMGGRKYLLNSKEMNGNLFDLQGRRVSKPKKGLYISQGRKVVIN